jgi:hypothetical protein
MFVSFVYMLSCVRRSLCGGLIMRPGSPAMCLIVCDLKNLNTEEENAQT